MQITESDKNAIDLTYLPYFDIETSDKVDAVKKVNETKRVWSEFELVERAEIIFRAHSNNTKRAILAYVVGKGKIKFKRDYLIWSNPFGVINMKIPDKEYVFGSESLPAYGINCTPKITGLGIKSIIAVPLENIIEYHKLQG